MKRLTMSQYHELEHASICWKNQAWSPIDDVIYVRWQPMVKAGLAEYIGNDQVRVTQAGHNMVKRYQAGQLYNAYPAENEKLVRDAMTAAERMNYDRLQRRIDNLVHELGCVRETVRALRSSVRNRRRRQLLEIPK